MPLIVDLRLRFRLDAPLFTKEAVGLLRQDGTLETTVLELLKKDSQATLEKLQSAGIVLGCTMIWADDEKEAGL